MQTNAPEKNQLTKESRPRTDREEGKQACRAGEGQLDLASRVISQVRSAQGGVDSDQKFETAQIARTRLTRDAQCRKRKPHAIRVTQHHAACGARVGGTAITLQRPRTAALARPEHRLPSRAGRRSPTAGWAPPCHCTAARAARWPPGGEWVSRYVSKCEVSE